MCVFFLIESFRRMKNVKSIQNKRKRTKTNTSCQMCIYLSPCKSWSQLVPASGAHLKYKESEDRMKKKSNNNSSTNSMYAYYLYYTRTIPFMTCSVFRFCYISKPFMTGFVLFSKRHYFMTNNAHCIFLYRIF